MPGPRDDELVLRDGTTDLTADETITATIRGGNHHTNPLGLFVLVPEVSDSDTLAVSLTLGGVAVSHSTALADTHDSPFTIKLPLPLTTSEALSITLNVTGTSIDLGAVQVWLERCEQANVPA